MAGNKTIYDTAMKRAHDHAWGNQWERAMKEYSRALAEFPNDRTALRNKAQCLLHLTRWQDALTAYQDLIKEEPGDLFAVNRLAEIYLALDDKEQAAQTYNRLADLYIENKQVHEAIRALHDLARALPKSKETHERLLDLNQEVGDRRAQAAEHVVLSRIALEAANLGEAQQHADAAATLDPDNMEVKRWIYTVRRRIAESASTVALAGDAEASMPGAPGTNLLQAAPEPQEALDLVQQASEAQHGGDMRAALDLYDRAVRAGARQPSVFYSAGLLSHQMGEAERAIPFLERAAQDAEYATSSHYMIGKCYSTLRKYSKAVVHFERALNLIDLQRITHAEADELIELYNAAAEANVADNNPGRAASLYATLANVFKEKRWAHPQVAEAEKKADELYNASIQSKLVGIGRGSGMLTADLPVEARLADATQLIQAKEDADATSRLQAGTGGMKAAPPARTRTPASDATTVIRKPGSNLRTITEYLRASDFLNTSENIERNEEPAEGTELLSDDLATTVAPQFGGIAAGKHTFTTLSNSAVMDAEQQTMVVQQYIAEAEYALGNGRYDAAIDSCVAVIATEPGYLPIHKLLAEVYLRQDQIEEAIAKYQTIMDTYVARLDHESAAEMCRRLIELQPDKPGLQTRLGLLLLEAGRVDEAATALLTIPNSYYKAGETQRALEEALNLKKQLPDSPEVALAIGTYLLGMGHMQDALVELSRALHLAPSNNAALVRLQIVLSAMHDDTQWDALQSLLERASKDKSLTRFFMEEFYSAQQRKPVPSVYYALSVLAERATLSDVAADALDKGLLQMSLSDTSDLAASWPLVEALMCQSRGDLAIPAENGAVAAQHYNRALEIIKSYGTLDVAGSGKPSLPTPRPQYDFLYPPEPTELYYGLAEAYAQQNKWEDALAALVALKKLIPSDPSVHTRIADIYFRQGNLSKALSELNDLLIHYQKAADHEKTLETLGHMVRLAPNNIAVRRKRADLYIKLGMTEYGLEEMNTLAELQLKAGKLKDAMTTYQRAGDLHFTLGQHDKAVGIYERIVRIAPRDIDARQQLINMCIQAGKVTQAVEGQRAMAKLFIKEGQTEEAIAALHQLIALSPEDVPALHMLAQQLVALSEYGQAARLYGRLHRLEPENELWSIQQSEMQRMAKEAVEYEEALKKQTITSKSTSGHNSDKLNPVMAH